jgi:hypothetical protein
MSVTDASAAYHVHAKTICGWLQSHVVDGNRNLVLELNRLRKVNISISLRPLRNFVKSRVIFYVHLYGS